MSSEPTPDALTQTFHHQIPLTRTIGLQALRTEESEVVLRAPLQPNLNHKHTAFGGSLNSVAVLAGWGWLWCAVQRMGKRATIVIHESRMHYDRGVDADFVARCTSPGPAELARFERSFGRRGRGRLRLDVEVALESEPEVALATFVGTYVVVQSA